MSFTVTLDDIREAAEKRFGNMEIVLDESTTVVLRNPLRLSKSEREELQGLQEGLNEKENPTQEEQIEMLVEILLLVSESKSATRRLVDHLEGDPTELMAIFGLYQDGMQVGEASPSQD